MQWHDFVWSPATVVKLVANSVWCREPVLLWLLLLIPLSHLLSFVLWKQPQLTKSSISIQAQASAMILKSIQTKSTCLWRINANTVYFNGHRWIGRLCWVFDTKIRFFFFSLTKFYSIANDDHQLTSNKFLFTLIQYFFHADLLNISVAFHVCSIFKKKN